MFSPRHASYTIASEGMALQLKARLHICFISCADAKSLVRRLPACRSYPLYSLQQFHCHCCLIQAEFSSSLVNKFVQALDLVNQVFDLSWSIQHFRFTLLYIYRIVYYFPFSIRITIKACILLFSYLDPD